MSEPTEPSATWQDEQEHGLRRRTEEARALVGRTVASAVVRTHSTGCDVENLLVLTMTDGTAWMVEGGYGGYTGHSCDEYFEYVRVTQKETTHA